MTHADCSAAYQQLREKARAIEAAWLVPTGRILSIYVQPAGGDAPGLHFSCVTLAGEEALAVDLPAAATLSELESTVKDNLRWAGLEFVSKDAKAGTIAPTDTSKDGTSLDARASEVDGVPDSSLCRVIASCWSSMWRGCCPYGSLGAADIPPVDARASELGGIPESSLCRAYEALTVKELASPKDTDRNYADGRIDTRTCRRCGRDDVTWNKYTEWCKMNGDAGGCMISVCMSCGLYLRESWDDDD